MDGWMGRLLAGWMGRWVGGWMDGWVGGWMDGWMDGWIQITLVESVTGHCLSRDLVTLCPIQVV